MCFLQSVNLLYHDTDGHYFFFHLEKILKKKKKKRKYLDHQAHDSDLGERL